MIETPCREWQGYRDDNGYGRRSGKAGRRFGTHLVHRQIMIMAGHNIVGKAVRHLCDNPPCFRYDHLAIGTQADNLADMVAKGRHVPNNRGMTHCKHGHEFTEENTHMQKRRNGTPYRRCRTCHRINALRSYRRRQ